MGIEGIDDLKPDPADDAETTHEPGPSGEPVEQNVVESVDPETTPDETETEVDTEAE